MILSFQNVRVKVMKFTKEWQFSKGNGKGKIVLN
jgi:hypothetical protein